MTKKSAEAPLTISAELARSLLAYDAETGAFVWRVDRGGKTKAGTAAGHGHNQGYRGIRLYGKAFLAHRIAWLMHFGRWPSGQIDHINKEDRA